MAERVRRVSALLGLGLLATPTVTAAAPERADPPHEEVLVLADDRIAESSGLVVTAGQVVTVNDSGDEGRVFTVDLGSGETVGVTTWSTTPVDVEALAPAGPGEVWVGDIGDNGTERPTVSVFRVPVGASQQVDPEILELAYPDGPHDAESLLAHPRTGRLFIVTKGLFGGSVYAVPGEPSADRPTELRRLGPVLGLATDAAFFPDGRHVVVRNYGEAVVYAFPSLEEVGGFRLPAQQQGEGVAVDARDRLLLSTEGAGQPLLRMRLPADVRRAMAPDPVAAPAAGPSDLPSDPESDPEPDPESDPAAEPGPASQPLWPWALGGVVLVAIVVVLVRSLRPPR